MEGLVHVISSNDDLQLTFQECMLAGNNEAYRPRVDLRELGIKYHDKKSYDAMLDESGKSTRNQNFQNKSFVGYLPEGILKKSWIHKHDEILPSVVVLVCAFDETGANDSNIQREASLLKYQLDPHEIPIVLVLFHESNHPIAFETAQKQERFSHRKHHIELNTQVNPKHCIILYSADCTAGNIGPPAQDVFGRINDLSYAYYKNKIKRLQGFKTDRTTVGGLALAVRHNYKLGMYLETLKTYDKAMKFYEISYASLISLTKSTDPHPYHVHELKCVAEAIHDRIINVYMKTSQNVKAILDQFYRHLSAFKRLVGPENIRFQHFAWVARQHRNFANVIADLGAAISLAGLPHVQRARCEQVYQLRLAALFAIRRRECRVPRIPTPSQTSLFIGGYKSDDERYAEESLVNRSELVTILLEDVMDRTKDARQRLIHSKLLAHEQLLQGYAASALAHLIDVCETYYDEKWFQLLQDPLKDLLVCAHKLEQEDSDEIDNIAIRRTIIHSAIKYLALSNTPLESRIETANQLISWMIERPMHRDANQYLAMGFSLDNLQTPLVEWSVEFSKINIMVGETLEIKLAIKSYFPIIIVFDSLFVIFSDEAYEFTLHHNNEASSDKILSTGDECPLSFAAAEERIFRIALQIQNHAQVTNLSVNQLQLKIKNHADKTSAMSHLSALSLWCKQPDSTNIPRIFPGHSEEELFDFVVGGTEQTETPVRDPNLRVPPENTVVVKPYESDIKFEIEHIPFALVGELLPIKLSVRTPKPVNGELFVESDMEAVAGSSVFFSQPNTPLELDETTGQPAEPLLKGVIDNSSTIEFFMLITAEQLHHDGDTLGVHVNVFLEYEIEGDIKVTASQVLSVPCAVPMIHRLSLIPPYRPNVTSSPKSETENGSVRIPARAPCYVELELKCEHSMELLDVVIQPHKLVNVNGENGSSFQIAGSVNQKMDKDDRLSLGFEIAGAETTDFVDAGNIVVRWRRLSEASFAIPMPRLCFEYSQFEFKLAFENPPVVGNPVAIVLSVANTTTLLQDIQANVINSPDFFVDGAHTFMITVPPMQTVLVNITVLPLVHGNSLLPQIALKCLRFESSYRLPIDSEASVFVCGNE